MGKRKAIIKGKFSLPKNNDKKEKKAKEEEQRRKIIEELKKKSKRIRKMSECNHIDKDKNKCRLMPFVDENGNNMRRCDICGAVVMDSAEDITPEMLDNANLIIRTLVGILRSKSPLDEKTYDAISNQLYLNEKLPDIYEKLLSDDEDEPGKKKKNKDKKKDKDITYRRTNY